MRAVVSKIGDNFIWLADRLAELGPVWWFAGALCLAAGLLLALGFVRGLFTRHWMHFAPLIVAVLLAGGLTFFYYDQYAKAPAPPPPPAVSPPQTAGNGEDQVLLYRSDSDDAERVYRETEGQASEQPDSGTEVETPNGKVKVKADETVYYATNRMRGPDAKDGTITYTAKDAHQVSYGIVHVTIPMTHDTGNIERPLVPIVIDIGPLHLGHEDARYNFTLLSNQALTRDGFRAGIAEDKTKRALIFVHGFDTSFKDAAYLTAQIAFDIQFQGTPVFFSWPSLGERSSDAYFYDYAKADASYDELGEMLQTVREAVGPSGHIYLVAHSAGNELLLQYLTHVRPQAVPKRLIDELVLAAPDVDADVFLSDLRNITQYPGHMTLYASEGDKALILSRDFRHGAPRAGSVINDKPVVIAAGEDTIDASAISGDFFRIDHGYYAADRLMISDMKALFSTGLHPPDRRSNFLLPIKTDKRGEYWQIPQ